jgi:hypothetical protein
MAQVAALVRHEAAGAFSIIASQTLDSTTESEDTGDGGKSDRPAQMFAAWAACRCGH